MLILAGIVVAALLVGFLAAHQSLLAVALVVVVAVALALLFTPDAATMVVIFLIYSNLVVIGVRFHGLPSISAMILPALLMIPLLYYLVVRREKLIAPLSLPWVALFLIANLISTVLSDRFAEGAQELIVDITEGFGLYFLLINTIRSKQLLRRVIWMLLLAGILMGAVPLYQQLTGNFDSDFGGLSPISNASFRTGETTLQGDVRQPRLEGAVGEMNRFAQVMLMLVPLALMQAWNESSRALKLLALAAMFFAGVGVVLTFSRGAAIGFVILLVFMLLLRVIKFKQLLLLLLLGLLLMELAPSYSTRLLSIESITGVFNPDTATSQLTENSPDGAIRGRLTVMAAAAQVFAAHPLFGVGPGNFKFYARAYSNDVLALRYLTTNREAHSLYLAILADTGLLGFIPFMMMLLVTLRSLFLISKSSLVENDMKNMARGLMLALIAYMATGIFLHFSYVRYFWIILAIASSASYLGQRELQAAKEKIVGRLESLEPVGEQGG